jgi:hypothetical protein
VGAPVESPLSDRRGSLGALAGIGGALLRREKWASDREAQPSRVGAA